ncbi:hypothetical protein THAOC_07848, partial [Thalassiosira oceanica]
FENLARSSGRGIFDWLRETAPAATQSGAPSSPLISPSTHPETPSTHETRDGLSLQRLLSALLASNRGPELQAVSGPSHYPPCISSVSVKGKE